MFSPSNRRQRFSLFSAVNRRWLRSRPGSVLILVIALLVLLALIGTAYLSSTQTERYTSVQNTINTEADLLMDGLKVTLNSQIANGLFGNTGVYREPSQEMPTYPLSALTEAPAHSQYFGYDAATVDPSLIPATGAPAIDPPDLFLADRIPYATPGVPTWNTISWPLFKDSQGGYTFDSPFAGTSTQSNIAPVEVGYSVYKGRLSFRPTSLPLPDGTLAPAMQIVIPGAAVTLPNGAAMVAPVFPIMAADADGDGIADSCLFKLPIGPIDGITYYAATRVIDNNSAINACTAWSSNSDFAVVNGGTGSASVADSYLLSHQLINYGFFRSNIGLREMLWPARAVSPADPTNLNDEMDRLNAYRFNTTFPPSTGGSGPSSPPTVASAPIADDTNPTSASGATPAPTARSDFSWYSLGDTLDQQLTRRPGNPANWTATTPLPAYHNFTWLGTAQSSALAYKFALRNPNAAESTLEQIFDTELYNYPYVQTTPYSPAQVYAASTDGTAFQPYDKNGYWYGDLFTFDFGHIAAGGNTFYMPLRTILTADNPISNAVAGRYGNTTSSGPVAYSSAPLPVIPYEFGDWVTYNGYSYVCLLHNTSATPQVPSLIPGTSPEYWARVPWSRQPVKTSVNTATFDQLWLGFCHVMTDSITPSPGTGFIPLWNPPMLPSSQQGNYMEKQMQMFRSVIRDNRAYPQPNDSNTGNPSALGGTRVQLSPMQMMQLRAAIAAINTQAMRNTALPGAVNNQQSRSHRIVLFDNAGLPAYDVEVYSTDIQPYIGQVYAVEDPSGGNFIAIQLLNPYPVAINVTTNWAIATIDRTLTNGATPALTLTNAVTSLTAFTIPAATATGPGMFTIYDGSPPTHFTIPIPTSGPGQKSQMETGLLAALGTPAKELVILKPRRFDNSLSQTAVPSTGEDTFQESTASVLNLFDLVPVDQIDLSGADKLTMPAYMVYKRAANPSQVLNAPPPSYAWNFVWPGFYTPYNPNNSAIGGPTQPQFFGTSQCTVPYAQFYSQFPQYQLAQAISVLTTEPAIGAVDFTILTGGASDPTAQTAASPTYPTIPLQINNVGFPGPNPVGTSAPYNCFPFGGFARNVDMMQIPFIGAYRIAAYPFTPSNPVFYELNSVTMDASLANDSTLQPSDSTNPYISIYPSSKVLPAPATWATPNPAVTVAADTVKDPFVEQIGRFCPIGEPNSPDPAQSLDFGQGFPLGGSGAGADKKDWHYHWAKRIFDYFTVQAPHDDYFPNNVDPAAPDTTVTSTPGTPPAIPSKFPNATDPTVFPPTVTTVVPVNNSVSTSSTSTSYFANALAANHSEDTVGVQGLININTAPWPVLARLPFVTAGTDNLTYTDAGGVNPAPPNAPVAIPDGIDDNVNLAKAIVAYRNQNGPFQSIEDLYKVPAFRMENEFLMSTDPLCAPVGTAPTIPPLPLPAPPPPVGDFSGGPMSTPAIPASDGVRLDFEERFLLLNQISNLITTRSDTFTCYLLLQGWRNVGTGNPTLAVQRRSAYLLDRNAITPVNTQVTTFNIPH